MSWRSGAALTALALAQPLAGAVAPVFGLGTPIGAASAARLASHQPLPSFSVIWGVIFAAFLLSGLAVLHRNQVEARPIVALLILAGIGNIVWMLSAHLIVSPVLNLVLLAPIIIASWLAASRLETERPRLSGSLAFRALEAASGLLAGWSSFGVAISLPLTLRSLTGLGPTDFPWPMFWLSFASAAGAAFLFRLRIGQNPWFLVALGWGLLGIAVNNWTRTGTELIGHFAFAGLLLISLFWMTRARKPATTAV